MANNFYKQNGSYFLEGSNQKINNLTELSNYSKAGGKEIQMPGVAINGAQFNTRELQQANFTDIKPVGNTLYGTPKVAKSLTSDQLTGGGADIKTETPISSMNAVIAGINGTMGAADVYKSLETARTNELNDVTARENAVNDTIVKSGGEGQALKTAYKEAGVNDIDKELADVKIQRQSAKARYDSQMKELGNSNGLTRIIGGSQDKILKDYSIEYGNLSALELTLQGNINAAKATAKETVDLEYDGIENQLKLQLQQLSNAYNKLDTNDKKRADDMALVLNQKQQAIETEKETKKNIADVILKAAQNGADANTLQGILKSTSYTDAITKAGGFLNEKDEGKWKESDQTDANGNPMLFNDTTGEYKTMTGKDANGGFTDATGTTWNVAGWATDPTKASQMQSIANQIGKVDDSNIEAKVKQFTPGLTANMIKETSAKTGISWEAIMTMVKQESLGGTSGVAVKNNNYAGLTWSANTQWKQAPYNGTIGSARPEGGNYIKFPTKQAGLDAMAALMAQYGTIDNTNNTNKTVTEETSTASKVATDWAENIRDGKAKLSDITSEVEKSNPGLKSEVNSILKSLPPSEAQVKEAQRFVKELKNLRDSNGLKSAVGPTGISRGTFGIIGSFGARDEFLGKAETLISKKALDSLIEAKSQGATFGALSDAELALLKSSGTTLGAWANEKNGKLKNFDVTEKAFKEELDRMIDGYEDLIGKAGSTQSLDAYLKFNPDKVDEYDAISSSQPDLTEEEILQVLSSN